MRKSAGDAMTLPVPAALAEPTRNGCATGWTRGCRPRSRLTVADRPRIGLDQMCEIPGKVWIWVVIGISIGVLIHGYVPGSMMLRIMAGALPVGRLGKGTLTFGHGRAWRCRG